MDRGWYGKLALVIGVTLATIWLLVPTYYSMFVVDRADRNNVAVVQQHLPGWAPSAKYRLNLGLDLQGGIHMVMRVDTKTALQKRTERRGEQIARYINDKQLGEVTAEAEPEKLLLTLRAKDPATMDAIEKEVLATFVDFVRVSREADRLVLTPDEGQVNRFREEAVDQAMLVIRRRIDKWGVAEVDVRKLGTDAIQISLPGRSDPEQAKELVGTTAQLEFRVVDDNSRFFAEHSQQNPPPEGSLISLADAEGFPALVGPNREALLSYVAGHVPEGREVLLECIPSPVKKGVCESYRSFLVEREAPLTGESLTGADVSLSQLNEPEVNISFDPAGAREFERLTRENTGRRMAIVLDDYVQSAPRINEPISGGRARITLGSAAGRPLDEWLAEAQTLALALKAGALPAPVTTGEIRQVGASLGDELIRKGSRAAVAGLVLVLIFMAMYYRRAGVIADVALVLNGLFILGGLALFNATLTLPGIAGFILTLGMGVDANVLINERIREELSHGKTARAAMDQGYDRAFWTIFDAQVTSLIAGFILFFTGTGPVRGFATTLIIGLIASIFTSLVVTRLIMSYFVHGRNAQTVSV
jgi:preprotein translocase subunit SecD